MGKAVVPGQKQKHFVMFRDRKDGESLLRIGCVVALTQHYSLWIGSSAGGVTYVCHIVGTDRFIYCFK